MEKARTANPLAFRSAKDDGELQQRQGKSAGRLRSPCLVVQRYLRAVESGMAHGWHTLVYGATLSVYSLPVLQGLVSYERQTLLGFIHAVARCLRLSETDCANLIDQLTPTLPRISEPILGEEQDPRHTKSF